MQCESGERWMNSQKGTRKDWLRSYTRQKCPAFTFYLEIFLAKYSCGGLWFDEKMKGWENLAFQNVNHLT